MQPDIRDELNADLDKKGVSSFDLLWIAAVGTATVTPALITFASTRAVVQGAVDALNAAGHPYMAAGLGLPGAVAIGYASLMALRFGAYHASDWAVGGIFTGLAGISGYSASNGSKVAGSLRSIALSSDRMVCLLEALQELTGRYDKLLKQARKVTSDKVRGTNAYAVSGVDASGRRLPSIVVDEQRYREIFAKVSQNKEQVFEKLDASDTLEGPKTVRRETFVGGVPHSIDGMPASITIECPTNSTNPKEGKVIEVTHAVNGEEVPAALTGISDELRNELFPPQERNDLLKGHNEGRGIDRIRDPYHHAMVSGADTVMIVPSQQLPGKFDINVAHESGELCMVTTLDADEARKFEEDVSRSDLYIAVADEKGNVREKGSAADQWRSGK